jgi:CubicO group peptidase (beta-lactamase class C family)
MSNPFSRRTLIRATTGSALAAATAATLGTPASAAATLGAPVAAADLAADPADLQVPAADRDLFRALDAKIRAGMAKYQIPGVAVGMLYHGREYVRGYGVTNVDHPTPVDGDTVFQIGSTSKTFTGTTVMRLVEQGKIDLDAPVRTYLPDLRTADPAVAARVTVRQLLNHSAGWLGDCFTDHGRGDDALDRYVAGLVGVPQLTPVGEVFAYNNAALSVAGRVVAAVTGTTYEAAVRSLLIDPLGLGHSRFFNDEIIGFNIAASHNVVNGKAVVMPELWYLPRTINPAGGVMSTARDQLRYARFHLGDGTVPGTATRLLTRESLVAMRSNAGPGGTLFVELDGMGVTWMLRPTAQGIRVVQHGGDWGGQHSGFVLVPDRGFAFTLLTNSITGSQLTLELFADDWALRRFAGVSNLPATPQRLSEAELAPYVGAYTIRRIGLDGVLVESTAELVAADGRLNVTAGGQVAEQLAFYKPDYVLVYDAAGQPVPIRANFVRDHDGRIAWLRLGGRLAQRGGATAGAATATRATGPTRLESDLWSIRGA